MCGCSVSRGRVGERITRRNGAGILVPVIVRAVSALVVLVMVGMPLTAVVCNALCRHEPLQAHAHETSTPQAADEHQHHQVASAPTEHEGHHMLSARRHHASQPGSDRSVEPTSATVAGHLASPRDCCGQVSTHQAWLTPRRQTEESQRGGLNVIVAASLDRILRSSSATGPAPSPPLSPQSPHPVLTLPLRI
jgi:hypothetical protein